MSTDANSPPDVLIVVRGVSERTEQAVVAMARQLVGSERTMTVSGAPFSETLRKSFEVAIERDLPWTWCVDADILPLPAALRAFRSAAQVAPSDLFAIQGIVLDKLFGGGRGAGHHLYRTALLEQALTHLSRAGKSKRPETFVRQAMQRQGYERVFQGIVMGLHGFEQYYRDLYRTGFFHAQKHTKYISLLRSYWKRMSEHDADFLIALRGADDGAREEKILGLDVRNFTERSAHAMADLGLTEKETYQPTPATLAGFVDNTISNWEAPPEYDAFCRLTRAPSRPAAREPSRVARLLGPSMLRRLGLGRIPDP